MDAPNHALHLTAARLQSSALVGRVAELGSLGDFAHVFFLITKNLP